MIFLDCSGMSFGSQLDEKHLFQWARKIDCFVRWQQDTLVVRSRRISQVALRDLIALFWRYGIPMQQLAQFQNSANEIWFTSLTKYWHKKVFSPQPSELVGRTSFHKKV
jgi:hypothetical protein